MLTVTSPSNPRLNEATRLLASSHERRKSSRCVIEGEHLIEMYAARHGVPETLIVTEPLIHAPLVRELAEKLPGNQLLCVSDALFKNIASLPPAVGMMAVVDIPLPATKHGPFCVLLEDVQDPGNVGTVLRTAAAAGASHVVLSAHCASAWAPKVLRAAQGAHFLLNVVEGIDAIDWAHQFRQLHGGHLVGTVVNGGRSLFTTALQQSPTHPLAFVFGNEGAGLSPALMEHINVRITIPMPGGMESLNVAAAAAISLFEHVRQQEGGTPL